MEAAGYAIGGGVTEVVRVGKVVSLMVGGGGGGVFPDLFLAVAMLDAATWADDRAA